MSARKNPPRIHHTFIAGIKINSNKKEKQAIAIADGEKSRKLRADTREANIEISTASRLLRGAFPIPMWGWVCFSRRPGWCR